MMLKWVNVDSSRFLDLACPFLPAVLVHRQSVDESSNRIRRHTRPRGKATTADYRHTYVQPIFTIRWGTPYTDCVFE